MENFDDKEKVKMSLEIPRFSIEKHKIYGPKSREFNSTFNKKSLRATQNFPLKIYGRNFELMFILF
jgi:hypothetical protein